MPANWSSHARIRRCLLGERGTFAPPDGPVSQHPRGGRLVIGPDPIEVLDALGIAWGVYELYPNPAQQHAFLSAAARLNDLEGASITFEIGAGSVACDGQELKIERGGTQRLSLRLFVHEVEWLEIAGAPSPSDLVILFELLADDEHLVREAGGIAGELRKREIWSVSVTQRGLMTELLDNAWEERIDDSGDDGSSSENGTEHLLRMMAAGASATEVVGGLVDKTGGNPATMAESFTEAYRVVFPDAGHPGAEDSVPEMLEAYKHAPRGRSPIETFVEAFFLLPVEAQTNILEDFLDRREEGMHALLLDQFAGAELAQLAPHLEPATYEKLVDYARDIVESEVGSAEELLPFVSAARDVKSARLGAADRIRQMIEGIGGLGGATGGLAGRLRGELTDLEQLSAYVLTNLFEIEERPDRFELLVHGWARRISTEVQQGRLDRALSLVGSGTADVDIAPSKRRAVEQGLVDLLRSDYAVFHTAAQEPEQREALAEVLAGFGEPAAVHLMERLSIEEDPATRRVLISLLVVVGSNFSEPIVRFFKDPAWYVVRNAVSIAGKIGGRKWVPHLRVLLDHDDHRVVIEAMRALTPLSPDEAVPGLVKGLAHESERVRESAHVLLQSLSSPKCLPELTTALTDPDMDLARKQVASLLYEMGTPEARNTLEQVARSFAVSPSRRHARRAAREILGRAA